MIEIKAYQIYVYHFNARSLLLNVFFLNSIDCIGLEPSIYHFKVVGLATSIAPFIIHQVSSWFMLLSAVLASFSGDDFVICMFFSFEPIFFICNCIKVP